MPSSSYVGLLACTEVLIVAAGVHWFEIDRREVLDAKGQALQRMGVQLSQGDGAAPARHRLRSVSPGVTWLPHLTVMPNCTVPE